MNVCMCVCIGNFSSEVSTSSSSITVMLYSKSNYLKMLENIINNIKMNNL